MSYRRHDYDPDYEPSDAPKMTDRKRGWHVGVTILMLATIMGVFTPLVLERWFWLALIWGGAVISAVSGVIYNPHIVLFKEDDPTGFWWIYAVGIGFSILATYFVLQSDLPR